MVTLSRNHINVNSTNQYLILYFPVDQFSVGDIVWAKYYREPYWPAQVSLILILFHSIITII